MEFDKLFEDLKEDAKTNEMEPAEVQNLYIFKKLLYFVYKVL